MFISREIGLLITITGWEYHDHDMQKIVNNFYLFKDTWGILTFADLGV